ncbi:MAG: hypothetical protein GEV11_09155 [Streptosporangiales bacterium]|nr:hypothetical protein [Streptosporangiales bacterium]
MTWEAREEILARVRRAQLVADVEAPKPDPGEYARALPAGTDLVALFTERAAAAGAAVRHVSALEDLPRAVAAALWARHAHRVVVPPGLPWSWLADLDGVRVVRDEPAMPPADLDEAGGVVTGCAVAVAASGTVVLDGGPAQGRRALLLTGHHVCVVRARQIVGTVPEAVARLDPRQPTTWLTGPLEPPAGETPPVLDLVVVDA